MAASGAHRTATRAVAVSTQLKRPKGCPLTGQPVYQTVYSLSSAVPTVATVATV